MGLPPVFPPLVNSEYVKGNPERLVAIILAGVMGPIEVDGKQYNNLMPAQGAVLTDTKISQVASFVRSTFGGGASPITVEQVAEARKKHGARATGWTEAELKAFPAN
jgi:mono/diheme cytochrome c family protein